jgi:hypothetical protein
VVEVVEDIDHKDDIAALEAIRFGSAGCTAATNSCRTPSGERDSVDPPSALAGGRLTALPSGGLLLRGRAAL